jgi:PAS domain S-box-containing protein
MDKRLTEISSRLIDYSLGRFDKRIPISPVHDELDGISNGINMLGEELKAITISRDYFTNIFNAVSDMVFIVNSKGIIEDVNKAAEDQLKYAAGSLRGKPLDGLHKAGAPLFKGLHKDLKTHLSLVTKDAVLATSEGKLMQVRMRAGYFNGERRRRQVVVTATDITFQLKTENLLIRAIIDTQEKERNRLAKDLHDSLTQQLSAIKFYISSTLALTRNNRQQKILYKSNEALNEVITDMRNICFNLMPKTLEEFGLFKAVQGFCKHIEFNRQARFHIKECGTVPRCSPEMKIDLYRVVQEFINNAVKHGRAAKISIQFNYTANALQLTLKDNGRGFDIATAAGGMGIQNVYSRVKSHNGLIELVSVIGKGTRYTITIPII